MRRTVFWLMALGSVAVAGYALWAYLAMEPGSTVHPRMREVYRVERVGILVHVICSAIALALGPAQFVGGLRAARLRLHRVLGRVYLFAGVLPGGLAGLYMAFHSFGGMAAHTGFAVGSVVWLVSAAMALRAALRRDFASHRAWMIANFALTFAAVTLRLQLGLCALAGLRFETFYPWLAWTSWVPNLFAAWLLARAQGQSRSV